MLNQTSINNLYVEMVLAFSIVIVRPEVRHAEGAQLRLGGGGERSLCSGWKGRKVMSGQSMTPPRGGCRSSALVFIYLCGIKVKQTMY